MPIVRRKYKAKKPAKKPVVVVELPTIISSSTAVPDELLQSEGDVVEEQDEVEATNGNSDTLNLIRDDSEILMTEIENSEVPVAIDNDNDEYRGVNMDSLGLIDGGAVSNGFSEPEIDLGPNLPEDKLEAEVNDDQNNNFDLLGNNNQNEESESESESETESETKSVSEGDEDNEDDEDDGDDDAAETEKDLKHDNKDSIIEENTIEIFVGGLDKKVVEDDLIEVFGKFGEVKAARVVRKANTGKSKGFAFIQYATLEDTKYALSELKEGIEVKGKQVKISTSHDKDALYIGNISETWTKEQMMEKLKEYGIQEIVDIQLSDYQRKDKEFAVLKLSSHFHALEAFKRLSMPDAVFGRDISAMVAFKHRVSPNDEALLQVKKVYIEWPTADCNEEKLKEICMEYGEITEVNVIKSSGKNRKDFGFVGFTSHEMALACVQGINNASVGEDKVEVKAAMAKTQLKGRTRIFSGGFPVKGKKKMNLKKEDKRVAEKGKKQEISELEKLHSNQKRKGKAAMVVEPDKKSNKNNNKKNPRHIESQTSGREQSKIGNGDRKRKNQTFKSEGNNSKARVANDYNTRPQKRAKENKRGRQSNYNVRNPKGDDHHIRNNYQGHLLASKIQSSDMEPHAGLLQPVGVRQVYPYPGYDIPRSEYLEQPVYYQSQSQSQHYGGYREIQPLHVIYRHHEREPQTSVWSQYSGHRQPYPVEYTHNYVTDLPLPPYAAKYSSYPAYEGRSPVGYNQSNDGGIYAPRRSYY